MDAKTCRKINSFLRKLFSFVTYKFTDIRLVIGVAVNFLFLGKNAM
jgi:hypothetical protein